MAQSSVRCGGVSVQSHQALAQPVLAARRYPKFFANTIRLHPFVSSARVLGPAKGKAHLHQFGPQIAVIGQVTDRDLSVVRGFLAKLSRDLSAFAKSDKRPFRLLPPGVIQLRRIYSRQSNFCPGNDDCIAVNDMAPSSQSHRLRSCPEL